MTPTILDPRTGKPESRGGELLAPSGVPFSVQENLERGWRARGFKQPAPDLSGVPSHILDLLEKSREGRQRAGDQFMRYNPVASGNFYEQPLYWILADGTQVLNTTTETIMVPSFTLPAGYLQPGSTLKYTLFFDASFVITTPGTMTLRLRYNGTGGTALAASGAYAPDPTAGQTTRSGYVEYLLTCRTIGTAGTVMCMGRMWLNDLDDASATTLQGNLNMHVIPTNAPATAAVNTTTANTLDPTVQFSVATATTQLTAHLALLESIV